VKGLVLDFGGVGWGVAVLDLGPSCLRKTAYCDQWTNKLSDDAICAVAQAKDDTFVLQSECFNRYVDGNVRRY